MTTWTLRNLEDGVSTSISNTRSLEQALETFGITLDGFDWVLEPSPRNENKWFASRKSTGEDFILIRS